MEAGTPLKGKAAEPATVVQKRRRARAVRGEGTAAVRELVLPLRKQGGQEVLPLALQFVGDGYVVSELSSVLTIRGSGARAVGRGPSGGAGVRVGDELLRCNGVGVRGQRAAAKLARAIDGVLEGIPEGGTVQVRWEFRQSAAGSHSESRAEHQASLYQRRIQAATGTTALVLGPPRVLEPPLAPRRWAVKWHRLCARALVRMRRASRPCVTPRRIARRGTFAETPLSRSYHDPHTPSPRLSNDPLSESATARLQAALEVQAALIGLERSNSSYTHQALSDAELTDMHDRADSEEEAAVAAVFHAASVAVTEQDLANARPTKQREPEPEPEPEAEPEGVSEPKLVISPSGRSPRYPTQAEWTAARASSTNGSTLSIIDAPFPKLDSWEGLPSRFPTLTEWIAAEDRAADEQQLVLDDKETSAAANDDDDDDNTTGTEASHLPPRRVASLRTPGRLGPLGRAGKLRNIRSSTTDADDSSDSDDGKGSSWSSTAAAVPRVSESVPPPSPRKDATAARTSSISKPTRACSWSGLDSSQRYGAATTVGAQLSHTMVGSASSAPVNDNHMAPTRRRKQKRKPMAELSWWWGGGPIDKDEELSPPRLPAAVFSPRQQENVLASLNMRSNSLQDVSSVAFEESPPDLHMGISSRHPSADPGAKATISEASSLVTAPAAEFAAAAAAKATAVAALEAELESMRASHAETVAEQIYHQNAHNLAVAEQHEQQSALEATKKALQAEAALATAKAAQAAADAAADATRALLESQVSRQPVGDVLGSQLKAGDRSAAEPEPEPEPVLDPTREPQPAPEPPAVVLDTATPQTPALKPTTSSASTRLGKQLTRQQVRTMVRIQLEIDKLDTNVSDAWIDSLFDRFDADKSDTIDDDEWDNLRAAIPIRSAGAGADAREEAGPRARAGTGASE